MQTDEGKQNKQLSIQKRSLTMAKIKEEKMANIIEKKCSGYCSTIKSINNFCKKSASADGYQSWCKECTNNKKKELRLNCWFYFNLKKCNIIIYIKKYYKFYIII